MAIWQFRLTLLPADAVERQCGGIPDSIPAELAEDFAWWAETQPIKDFEDLIGQILPERASWSDSMRMWGGEEEDDFTVIYADKGMSVVEEVFVRLDARRIATYSIRGVIGIATKLECLLLTTEYGLLPADESKVFAALINSTARRFVDDPVNTLKEVGRLGKFGTVEISHPK
jgi:hypothetical protein